MATCCFPYQPFRNLKNKLANDFQFIISIFSLAEENVLHEPHSLRGQTKGDIIVPTDWLLFRIQQEPCRISEQVLLPES